MLQLDVAAVAAAVAVVAVAAAVVVGLVAFAVVLAGYRCCHRRRRRFRLTFR